MSASLSSISTITISGEIDHIGSAILIGTSTLTAKGGAETAYLLGTSIVTIDGIIELQGQVDIQNTSTVTVKALHLVPATYGIISIIEDDSMKIIEVGYSAKIIEVDAIKIV